MRKFFSWIVYLGLFFSFVSGVSASTEFTTSLVNIQTVDEKGLTHVSKKFTLTNNLSTVYITKYGLEINSPKIENVRILDSISGSSINANINKTENSTTIGIEFPDIVVGKNKKRSFAIEYDDPDAAIVSGNILEVYVPRIAEDTNLDTYETVLKIPKKFGQPTIAHPNTYTLTTEGEENVLSFTQDDNRDGVSIIFGEKQFFNFSLDYNLQNPTGTRGITQIALPPDTPYQKVQYSDIEPRPQKIELDADGNWIATYLLEANQNSIITAKGTATIYLEPEVEVPEVQPQPEHILHSQYWESDDPIIQNIAKKYQTPKQIFDFDVSALEYNYDRLNTQENRQGAKSALENSKNAVCQEFTDVFIAIARANNIPSRQATGYAFTNNSEIRPLSLVKDVLHAWPEYYDEVTQRWVPVDPTWANTTNGIDYFTHLDFSHFVFAYQGVSSNKPYPAGAYKNEGPDEKNVFVTVTDQELDTQLSTSVKIIPPFSSFFNLIGNQTLAITNSTGVAWYNVPVSIQTPPEIITDITETTIEKLLPYQTVQIPFEAVGRYWHKTDPGMLTLKIGDEGTLHEISASSKLQSIHITPEYVIYFGVSFVVTTVLILLIFRIIKKLTKKDIN